MEQAMADDSSLINQVKDTIEASEHSIGGTM